MKLKGLVEFKEIDKTKYLRQCCFQKIKILPKAHPKFKLNQFNRENWQISQFKMIKYYNLIKKYRQTARLKYCKSKI